MLVGDGGRLQRNYFDPKDPRKKRRWSETVETRPLHVRMLVDPTTPWLSTPERVGYLCSVRVKMLYFRCLEAREVEELITIGKTWTHVSKVGVTGKLIPLNRIASANW